jgi:hypothetical protein
MSTKQGLALDNTWHLHAERRHLWLVERESGSETDELENCLGYYTTRIFAVYSSRVESLHSETQDVTMSCDGDRES